MKDKSIELYLGDKIEHFEDRADHTLVFLASGKRLQADIVVMAIGVLPETTLARAAGLELGPTGGIKVDAFLRTSDPAIYAVGDAVEVTQTISGRPALIPLAGPANRQGRIAADNMLAPDDAALKSYKGTLGTAILKVFDLAAATTGLNEVQLAAAGIPYRATITHSGSHASYYPGSKQLSLKLIYGLDGRILGAQAVGADGADKRIDVIAATIHAGGTVADLAEQELAYAPPFGSAKDPVNIAGYVAMNVLNGSHEVIDWRALRDRIAAGLGDMQLLDVRTPEEFAIQTLPGARNIELDRLRTRLAELDPTRPVVVFCQIGMRGYLAYRILRQSGFTDVKNLSGGIKTYLWATEKQANPDIFDYEDIKRRDPAELEGERTGCAVVMPVADRVRIDAVGLQCPGPIMKTFRAMEALDPGQVVEVTASDPAFGRDVRAWGRKTGHEILSVEAAKGLVTATIRKGASVAPAPVAGTRPASDKFTLVVFSGDLDKVMASLIIANGAMAMGRKVSLFFTFWGLNVLRRPDPPKMKKDLIASAFGFMLPKGAARLNSVSKMNFGGLGARMMKMVMRDKRVDTPADLLQSLVTGGAQLIACQMSMDVMGIREEELIRGVELGGVAAFLAEAQESGTTLFI